MAAKKPNQDELSAMIDKGMGKLLTPQEVDARKKSGELPDNFKVEEGFGVYRIDLDGNEYLCVTNVLCEKCQRVNGKVKRCEAHKRKRRARRVKKDGDVVDDTSDREKLGGLRHVDDDEDEDDKVDGAVTPDAVLTPGVGGAIIVVPVDAKNNEKAGPPAKNMNHVKGILVRGAGNIPQFIPNDRVTKTHKLRFDNYIEGELILQNGKEVFVPNTLGAAKMDEKNMPSLAKAAVADKVDQKVVDELGKDLVVAVQVDVADNGMPVMKVLEELPKDKETPVGIIVRANDQTQFVQIAGRELGGGKDAKMMPCTIPENAKTGDVIADIYVDADGKALAAKPGEVPNGATQLGQVVVGLNNQLVFVPKGENKDEYIKKCAGMTPAMKERLEAAQCKVQAAVTGQSQDHIAGQVAKIGVAEAAAVPQKAPAASSGEVRSVGFGNQFGGSQFAKASPGGGGGAGGGAGGAGGGKQYGAGGEVRSVAFGGNQHGGSVFAKASPGAVGASGGGGGGGGAGSKSGGAGAKSGGAGGKQYGAGGEVKSVAFGGNQYGGSVFAKAGGGGGASGAGAGKAGAGGAGVRATKSGQDVRSTAFGGNQFGASVYAKDKGPVGSAPTSPAPKNGATPKKGGTSSYGGGSDAKSVGFGVQAYGGSVYMRK